MKVERSLSVRTGSISENTLICIKRANNSLIDTHYMHAYGLINRVEFSNRFLESVFCLSVFFSTRSREPTEYCRLIFPRDLLTYRKAPMRRGCFINKKEIEIMSGIFKIFL